MSDPTYNNDNPSVMEDQSSNAAETSHLGRLICDCYERVQAGEGLSEEAIDFEVCFISL
jgi:hypothetical protein